MVRKQKNTRALIKKRNKQDGGLPFGKIFRSMIRTRSSVIAPTPGERIDPKLIALLQREEVKINEQRFFSRIRNMLLKSIGKDKVPVVNIEIEKAEQVKDKLIRITPSFKEKLLIFIKSVKENFIEKYAKKTDDMFKRTENLYFVSFSKQEKGVSYDEQLFDKLLLSDKEFLDVYDIFLLDKLKPDKKEEDNIYAFTPSSPSSDIKEFINIKFKDNSGNIILITSLNDEAIIQAEKIKSHIKTVISYLDKFFISDEYQLSAIKDSEEHPLIIDLNALRRAKNCYLDLYLDLLVDNCDKLKSILISDEEFKSKLKSDEEFKSKLTFDVDFNLYSDYFDVLFKYKLELIDKYNFVKRILNDNPDICQEYLTDLTNIDRIIDILEKLPKYQKFINDIKKLCFTLYTHDIFSNLKSFINSIEDDDSKPKPLLTKLSNLIKELIKNENNTAYTVLSFNKDQKASLINGGNHFIALLNHCNLCMKKEKKPDKKPAEKKPVKKPTEKKPVKKPTEKKPVKKPAEKKPVKKPAEKKPVKKPTEKKPVKKPTEKKPVKKPTEKKTTKKQ